MGVGFSALGRFRNDCAQFPPIPTLERCEGRRFQTPLKLKIAAVRPGNCFRTGALAEAVHRVPYLTVTICPPSSEMSFIWAMKMAATASYSAVPSMLMVAPMGSTKRVTRLSIFRFSSRHRKVTGNVPALRTEEREKKGQGVTKNWSNISEGHKIGGQVVKD